MIAHLNLAKRGGFFMGRGHPQAKERRGRRRKRGKEEEKKGRKGEGREREEEEEGGEVVGSLTKLSVTTSR